jgi:hypothetical protein
MGQSIHYKCLCFLSATVDTELQNYRPLFYVIPLVLGIEYFFLVLKIDSPIEFLTP